MDGIKAYCRETFERGWNYHGLWRESLDDQPSAAFVYRWLLISFTCLYALFVYLTFYPYKYKGGIRQPDSMFIFPSMEQWKMITLYLIIILTVYGGLWYWGKIKNNRHIISVLMYLMLFLIGVLAAVIVGFLDGTSEPMNLQQHIYRDSSIWWSLYGYFKASTLLLSSILLMWIQGWRQGFISSPIFVVSCLVMMNFAAGKGF